MNPILDALTDNVLGTAFSELRVSSFSSALNAYESWASELGVSSTGSVSTLANTDDGSAVFTLGFNPFKGGTVLKGFHSSEGGIGLYYQQDPGSATNTSGTISATSPNVSLSRFYTGYARMPTLLIATRLGTIDNRSESSRWQQTSDTAIFYSTYRQYNGTNGTVHVAIKITKENKITVVCSNVNSANTYLQFMTFNESISTRTATSVHGGTSFLLSLNTTQEVDLYLAAQVFSLNSELNLTPILNSAFYLQATKNIQLIAGSSLSRFVFGWVGDTVLFNEPLPIEQISLTFDQLGRPLVFYRVGEDTLKLYWYDPIAQQNVLTNFGIGKDPTACFDFPQDTGQSFTDVLLFYVREDQVFMRVQRDRYAIEYPCPANQENLQIISAGLRVDNRLQVVYEYLDVNYDGPKEIPVVVMPEDETGDTELPVIDPENPVKIIRGKYFYNNQINNCLKTNFNIDPFSDYFKISFNIKSNLSSNLQYVFGCSERKELLCAFYKHRYSRSDSKYFINLWKAGAENNIALNVSDITGSWVFEFLSNNEKLIIKKDNEIIYNGLVVRGFNKNKIINLSLNGIEQNQNNSFGFKGITHEWVIETATKVERFPINTFSNERQNSVSKTDFVTIENHKISSWFLEKI